MIVLDAPALVNPATRESDRIVTTAARVSDRIVKPSVVDLGAFTLVNTSLLPTLDFPVNTTDHPGASGPTPEDEAERLALLAEREVEDRRIRDEAMTEYWIGVREATLAEHHHRWDCVSDDELIECRGHHPYLAHDI